MTERLILDIKDVDLSIPEGGLISISLAHSAPVRPNRIETTALGVLIGKYLDGTCAKPTVDTPTYYEDVTFVNGVGERVTITRDEADKPENQYVIVPFHFVMTHRRLAFVKNIVIVDDLERNRPYIIVDSLAVGSDPNFIPISASSILGLDLTTYILHL
jgi:hypothetical protein